MSEEGSSHHHGLRPGRWIDGDEAREIGRSLRSVVPAEPTRRCTLLSSCGMWRDTSGTPISLPPATAGLMAHDLDTGRVAGLARSCRDAHVANSALEVTHNGEIVMDINDFDGPPTMGGTHRTHVGDVQLDRELVPPATTSHQPGKAAPARVRTLHTVAATAASSPYRFSPRSRIGLPAISAWRTAPRLWRL